MKKILSFLCVLLISATAWAGYGILVNGCAYYEGTLNPTPGDPSFTEYMANVAITNGDYCQLYDASTQSKWAVDLDTYSVAGFTRDGDKYNCTVSGNFLFVIKLKYGQDQLYIGAAQQADQPQNICPTTGFSIAGNGVAGNPWVCGLDWQAAGCDLGEDNSITFTVVPAGSYAFKITNGTWTQSWGGAYVDAAASTAGYVVDKDGNASFKIEDAADITVSFDGKKIVLTSTKPFAPMYVSAVPSQCHDVLLQGFYYDSYSVDSAHAGTQLYGDTRWKTLYNQSNELGAYFDLIWLPPSAMASGTGYHPKQYSNQNSDWGSRTELTQLIKALHNSGTKVVADIVINHTEAMASWCDFATLNFGEYGQFVPDGSYICNTDEMNSNDPTIKKEAGECWGTATGNPDDGANWEAARDWSHDLVKVQEMFKAYLKWMHYEIGYDGWRYDKGDGFNNWHMDNYNNASEPYIAFMEYYSSNSAIKNGIAQANNNVMAFDFQTRWRTFRDGIAAQNFNNCRMSDISSWGADDIGLIASNMSKYAVTFIDNHDMFLRDDNDNEFCGRGNSMKPENKYKLMQANAYMLSMPGVPCVFYPHWAKYKEDLKPMINARHLAGVHSESAVTDEEYSQGGYKASVHGTNGTLILTMGDKTIQQATGSTQWLADNGYKKVASGDRYAIWVTTNGDAAPGLIVTPDVEFSDSVAGVKVAMEAVGGSGEAQIYYTLDGTDPDTSATRIQYVDTLTFTKTTTIKAVAVCGTAYSKVQTHVYTYREPLKHGIIVHFQKPDVWEKVYLYAWLPGVDEKGNPTAENIMGAYPGQRVYQDAKGWYSYEFDQTLDTIHFCINSGEDCGALNVRSNDLMENYDAYYSWEEGHEAEDKFEKKLEEEIPLNPEFDLVISPESGNFRDMNEGQRVQLTVVGHEGASIYYTTDGSDPATCAEPGMDTVSFVVKSTATVRAYAAYSPDPSSIVKTDEYSTTYTYKAPQSGAITVRFVQPKDVIDPSTGDTISKAWKDLYLYAFTRVKVGTKFKDTPYSLDGKSKGTDGIVGHWPGMKWTTTEVDGKGIEWHKWTMKSEIKEIYIIFTEGDKKPQTQDIYLTENMCYVWNPICRKAVEDPDCDGFTPEGLEEVVALPENEGEKFLYNDQLYIRVDGQVYDIFGRMR